ncbi:MAG: glycoside hydrolase family 2 [Planctomycetota bacterium]|nr:MAG: glycoside hydrolase family 2 [Planctomycetota bacterium]REJ92671.1 MAG: glycoside hydrolase family 2 [Planctomycetota bacterium]REK23707.1 MAG: glycoside hydrolase family 2 [Planctomycetota bacterium]REK47561.1 MAG: glycoside hydrolase family 2 [Planctomycetota bacterium]
MKAVGTVAMVILQFALAAAVEAQWKAAEGPLMTRWAKSVKPDSVHAEYPRPQMVRDGWQNLNGLWDYAIVARSAPQPKKFDGQILVPFPVESALSGVMKPVTGEQRLWYRRTFQVPEDWSGKQVLLHFGAVDWEVQVWVNGQPVGEHRGGYDPFSFNISGYLKPSGDQEIVVAVFDPTDDGRQPRGKQVRDPKGIWYTAVTGIWQTVWLEPVPEAHVGSLKIVPDVDARKVHIDVAGVGTADGDLVEVKLVGLKNGDTAREMPAVVGMGEVGQTISLHVAPLKLWRPEAPWLYDVEVTLKRGDEMLDSVTSYFGMRKISTGKDESGMNRLLLNDVPLFQFGPLDQGWWPDGLYTAPSDAALKYDLEVTKQFGYNMIRKHVKVEPARWYYHCDRMGLLVWQDMPSGDEYIRSHDPDLVRTAASARQFELELRRMIDAFGNHPSIVMWVPFNEGWGQFDTDRILAEVKAQDPSRLVDGPSGWADRGSGDTHDIHSYPGPSKPKLEEKRVVVLGEFGGLGLVKQGHLWQDKKNWGYVKLNTQGELEDAYAKLIRRLRPLIDTGLAAAVYTQTTDVEGEVNGLMTYDRSVVKMDPARMAKVNQSVYLPPENKEVIVLPTSEYSPQLWRYTTSSPPVNWFAADFDDSKWEQGPGGFGTRPTPGDKAGTNWDRTDIWLRRDFNLEEAKFESPHLRIHHDEGAKVYINGKLVVEAPGYTGSYILIPFDEQAASVFKKGKNVIAVHCHQTDGGQYIDVGIVDVVKLR